MENEEKNSRGLSTELSPAYQTSERPKNVKIEIGESYEIMDGQGTIFVTIVSIRKINNEILIYYKYAKPDGKWEKTWINQTVNLETFRARLLKFGEIKSLDLLYPTNGENNYYSE